MNKNLHRIVFNAARGARMAVQETARSAGKAAGGATSALATTTLAALLVATPLHAQIKADPGAPGHQRATVTAGPNGMPVVNIQTPSAAGVSRNVYRQFDVQAHGAILNNSRSGAQTQLAGAVPGNPWLARGPARIILNEVNSADPSQLRGYVEVAGQRAEVVIANPAGIQVDGAGFINASRATLTTGTAQFGADGGLAGFLVRGGSIRVEGAGLDASQTDYAAILSRALQVNAGIWATELKVVTGAGEVAADAGRASPGAGTGSAPAFALDVAALGGMYAGKITLIGTEAGVGARNAGRIGAGAGGLVVTASGRLENTGTMEAQQIALTSAGDIDNRGGTLRQSGAQGLVLSAHTVRNTAGGVIGAAGSAAASGAEAGAPATTPAPQASTPGTITAAGTLHNEGGHIQSGGAITLNTARLDNQSGAVLHLDTLAFTGERLSNAGGTLNVRNAFSAEVGRFDNSAGTLRAGTVAINATGDLLNVGGLLASRGDTRLAAAGLVDNTRGTMAVGGDLAVQATALVNNSGSVDVAGSAALDSARFANAGGTLTVGRAFSATAQHFDNSAGLVSAQSVRIATTGDLRNVGGVLASSGGVQLDVAGQWDNTRGSVASSQDLVARAASIVNDGGNLQAAGALALTGERFGNAAGVARAGGAFSADTEQFDNRGGTVQADSVRITASGDLRNAQGAITSAGDARLVAGGDVDNAQGQIAAGRNLGIEAARLVGGGVVDVAGAMTFKGERFTHAGGTLNVGQAFSADVTTFDNSGGSVQAGSLHIGARDGLANAGGTLLSMGNAHIAAGGVVDNTRGAMAVGADLRVQSTGLVNDGGQLDVAGTLAFTGEHLRNAADGQIHVNQAFSAQVDRFDNSAGTLRAGSVAITATGELRNAGGTLASTGALQADAAALDNRAGTVHADSLRIRAQGVIANAKGKLLSAGDASLVAGGQLDSTRGHIATGRNLAVQATSLVNQGGVLDVAGQLAFTGQQFSNAAGQAQVGQAFSAQVRGFDNSAGTLHAGSIAIAATGELRNAGGSLASATTFSADAASLDNTAGTLHAARVRIATAGDVRNAEGTLAATDAASVVAGGALDNTRGAIAAGQDLGIQATRLTNTGTVRAGNDIALRLADGLQNDGAITAARNTHITAASVLAGSTGVLGAGIRADGRLGTSGDLTVHTTQALQAHGSLLAAGNATLTGASVDLTGSTASATQLAITATQGDVRTRQAQVVASDTLAITASAQMLANEGGALSAGQLAIDVAHLANSHGGDIVQTGTGATRIAVAGLLDNSAGRIASNGASLQLQAATLANTAGRIQHAGTGTLAITANTFDGANGSLASNGALTLQAASTLHDGGAMAARQIAIDAGTLRNQGGQILHTGTGAARISASGALDNRGGLIATASGSQADLAVTAADIDNQGGRIVADGRLQLQAGAGLQNTDGRLRATSGLAIATTGQVTNTRGAIEAAGQAAALSLAAAQLDNTDGRIANAGTGTTLLAADSIANGRSAGAAVDTGLIAANGALVLQASTLHNQAGGLVTAGAALDLAVTGTLTNRGTIASGGTLVFDQAAARLDNAGGQIHAAGHARIAVRDIANDGGSITTTAGSGADLALHAQTLSNRGGTLASDRDLRLTLPGDYRNADTLRAGRNLHLTLGGALDNTGMLQAGAALRAQASAIDNAPAGRMQAQDVDLQAAGTVRNAGEITGAASARIAAASIANIGAITGGQVTLAAQAISNTGPQALIGATGDVALWARDSLHNTDGATIYAGRDVFAGASDARDAQGQVADAAGALVNRAATIEAARHIDMAAGTVLNERPGVAIEQVTSLDERHTLAMPSWWHNRDANGRHYAPEATNYSPYEIYYVNPADILESTSMVTPDGYTIGRAVIRTHANDTAFFSARAGNSGAYGHRERITSAQGTRVLYYLGRQEGTPNPDQVPGITSGVWQGEEAVTHWDAPAPAFNAAYGNCSTTCVRFVTQPGYTDPNSIMIRDTQEARGPRTSLYELSRDAHARAVDDRLAAGAGQAGRILAGGDLRVGFTHSLTNQHGEIMAGGRLRLDGAAGASVDNVATTLYRHYSFDGVRHYADGVALTYQQPGLSQVIGSVAGVLSGAQGVHITGGAIRNLDTSAGTAANIVQQVRLSSGSVAGASGPAHATGAQAAGHAGLVDGSAALAAASGAPSAGLVAPDGGGARLHRADRITTVAGPATGLDSVTARAPSLPPGGLFTTHTEASSQHLYQTRAGFSSPHGQTSSDALFSAMGLDPTQMQKRLGDGFYEQRLVREQVAELTGRRHLAGQADDDTQYAALLSAGATFAQQYKLRPGVALSADQMAALTSDIVWMEMQSVTLADGSVQQVLAPKVYLAQLGHGAVHPGGALITGADIRIEGDSIVNRGGTIGGSSTGRAVLVAREDLVNQGGTIQADAIGLIAGRDVRNESLTVTKAWSQQTGQLDATGRHTSLSNTARIEAGQTLQIQAGQDVVDVAGHIHAAGDARVQAGRDVVLGTLDTGSHYQARIGTASTLRASTQAQVGQLSATGDLAVHAGRDLQATGTQVVAGGDASLAAGRHIALQAANSSMERDQRNDPTGTRFRQSASATMVQGAQVRAGGNLTMRAGVLEAGDLRVIGSTVDAKGDVQLRASGDVLLGTAQTHSVQDEFSHSSSSGLFSKRSATQRDAISISGVAASTVSADTVTVSAGRDITAQAATLQSEGAMRLSAARDIALTTAEQTVTETHFKDVRKSATALGKLTGLALGGGSIAQTAIVGGKLISSNAAMNDATQTRTEAIGTTVSAGSLQMASGRDTTVHGTTVVADHDITMLAGGDLTIDSAQNTYRAGQRSATSQSGSVGTRTNPALGNIKQSQSSEGSGTTQSASQVASLQGDVTLIAGGTYTQRASSVLAAGQGGALLGGDAHIQARDVAIGEAFNTSESTGRSRSSSTVLGGSASVAGFSTDSLRNAGNTLSAIGDTGDGRMQALGAVNLAMQGKQAYDTAMALASGQGLGYKVTVSVSHNKSESQSSASTREAVGSSVVGADQVRIVATGGAADSDVRVTGSTISAGSTAHLQADDAIDLQASQSTWAQQGSNRSSGASVGVGFSAGAQTGFTIELGVSQGKGLQNGSEVVHTNTHVTGGQAVHLVSGGDLTLKGAVVEAPQVRADVGGDLRIESLQDTSAQVARQSSSGVNLSLCIPPICYGTSSVSASFAAAKANGSHASVVEQSGIRAGDVGFQVQVEGSTELKGGVVSSSQVAIDAQANRFDTASLTSSDIQNHSSYKASSYAVSASVSTGAGDQSTAKTPAQQTAAKGAGTTTPGGSAGAGSTSGSQSSTTAAGISAMAADTTVRTGDAGSTGALVKEWNAQALLKDAQAQARITQEFGQHASKAVGDYSSEKYEELKASDPHEAAKWAEGGAYRVTAHAAVGALTGGANGALGAGVSTLVMPIIGNTIDSMDLPEPVKHVLGAASATAIGSVVGATAGAASGFTVDLNNRQQHITERQALNANAKAFADHLRVLGYTSMTEERALAILQEQVDNRIDYTQATRLDTETMDPHIQAHAKKFLTTLGSALGSFDDGRGNQILYFSNITADGEKLPADYRDASINALQHVPPVDYVTLQGGIFGMNGGVSINTLNGEIFIGGAKTNFSQGIGASFVLGRVLRTEHDADARAELVSNMLSGASLQGSYCTAGFCVGLNKSIAPGTSNPATAFEIGIGTPGVSAGAGASLSTK